LNLKDFKNIAVIQTAFIGDVALSFYLVQNIKNFHTNCKIFFVTTPVSAPMASCVKAIDTLITFDKRNRHSGWKGIKNMSSLFKELGIHCIISPHRSFRTAILTSISKRKFSVSFDKSALSFLYSKNVKWKLSEHEIIRNNSLLSVFEDTDEILNTIPDVELEINDNDTIYIDNLMLKNDISSEEKIIALAPGSVWATKRWSIEHYTELSKKLTKQNFKVIIIGSKEDFQYGEIIRESNNEVINFCGLTTLPQLIYLLKNSNLLVTNDSSPTHLAGLVKTPTITIFGPTTNKFGFGPIGDFNKSVELENLSCHPCSIHGQKNCPLKHHKCMKEIYPSYVYDLIQQILRETS